MLRLLEIKGDDAPEVLEFGGSEVGGTWVTLPFSIILLGLLLAESGFDAAAATTLSFSKFLAEVGDDFGSEPGFLSV